ncbi:hypothetical protein M422DRAFT_175550 [Sphaerobolus stellatus SS14]|uniref:NACHT domain-containing protein n=1 Tax=Sphaerobolus stellatus (strain SS14) TaxID=990650 RepID=A0A0C9UWJ7_SPHS4|nr:hypothetical protein M422DRAFT_175550 [Sphaerobolus stellatus SS14]
MIEKQLERDDNIGNLLDTISRAYDIIRVASHDEIGAELQPRLESQKQVLDALTTLTIHCGNFITKYCQDVSFAARIVKNTLKDDSSRLELYMMSFEQLRKDLDSHAILVTQRVILQTEEEIIQIKRGTDFKIRDMVCANGAGFNTEKMCLLGTRAQLIGEILEWINSTASRSNSLEETGLGSPQPIFWLHGVAGCGKSAVAHTVGQILHRIHKLGSFFCFDVSQQSDHRHTNIFRTIAADLADQYPSFKLALVSALNRDLCGTNDLTKQWNDLLLEPAHEAKESFEGPIVIIIDALDESGDEATRAALLSILVKEAHKLPSNFCFLVTSRTFPDIKEKMDTAEGLISKDIATVEVKQDIAAYFQFHLHELDATYFNQDQISLLVERAGGLFQWAFLAFKFIKASGYGGHTSKQQFEDLARMEPYHNDEEKSLKTLYIKILSQFFGKSGEDAMKRFRLVIGSILAVTKPVTASELAHLLNYYDPAVSYKDTIQPVLKYMGALLSGITADNIPIHPLHTSFREFLTQDKASNQFYIDIKQANCYLAWATLNTLLKELKFNICNLESSYIANTAVEDLQERINNISFALRYSCHNWATHICNSSAHSSSSVLSTYVTEFTNSHLLFWIEVLSLEDKLQIASNELNNILLWLEVSLYIALLTHDTLKFLQVFGTAIKHSTPHLYLSALSFSPELSSFQDKYNKFFHQIPRIINGWEQTWPLNHVIQTSRPVWSLAISPDGKQIVTTSGFSLQLWNGITYELAGQPYDGHTSQIWSVAFSPDGKKIASGSYDTTLCIWDTEKHKIIGQPLKGHTGWVRSVAFAPDGKTIVSGSSDQTISIWDIEQQKNIAQLQDHTGPVTSVAISPDSKKIVSGSSDRNLRIWDAEKHVLIGQPLQGHTKSVQSVAFAPDGKSIVSGASDHKICIWDVEKQELIGQPLQGHTDSVWSVAFSPDGKTIVSGSRDNTVRVWDIEKHKQIGQPLQGHTNWIQDRTICIWDVKRPELMNHSFQSQLKSHTGGVNSVAFSPDGKKIVSGSYDTTLCIWNAEKHELIGQPLQGHTRLIQSVAFASDGKTMASGSDDRKVCIWDVEKQELIGQPLQGHTNLVRSVAFSPDKKTIVSGSWDSTVRIWDVEKHKQIGEPLQGHTHYVLSVAFSPNGKMIVSGSYDRTICIWDVEKQELIGQPLQGHVDKVHSVAFSPDGKTIVSGSWDNTVRVWDVEKHKQIGQPFWGHTDYIRSVAFTPDGKKIISGSKDNTIRIWDANIHDDIRIHQESKIETTSLIPSTAENRLLLWIPHSYRKGLIWTGGLGTFGVPNVELDLSDFTHGKEWTKCYKGNS